MIKARVHLFSRHWTGLDYNLFSAVVNLKTGEWTCARARSWCHGSLGSWRTMRKQRNEVAIKILAWNHAQLHQPSYNLVSGVYFFFLFKRKRKTGERSWQNTQTVSGHDHTKGLILFLIARLRNFRTSNMIIIRRNFFNTWLTYTAVGGTVVSWLVRSSPDRAVRVRALAVDVALRSWARHLTLTVPLSTQVYKWVPAN